MSASAEGTAKAQLEFPKSTRGTFELPCGYLDAATNELLTDVEVSEITGREEDMLVSPHIPQESKLSGLISGCLQRIGTITDKGRIARIVDELLVGDRVFLLFAIRRVTLGDELPFDETCPSCNHEHMYIIDLSRLDIQKMPDPRRHVYDVTLPSGRTARFRVSTGKDESASVKLAKKSPLDTISQAIRMRLELLDDVPPTLDQVKGLGLRDRKFLRDQFDSVEGGVDTSLELSCPACGHDWESELSVKGQSFFSLSGTRKRSKKKSSG